MMLTEHFTLEELSASDVALRRGFDNTPDPAAAGNMKTILAPGLEKVRSLIASPMHVLSGFRSLQVNIIVGGSTVSAHLYGYACDFVAPGFGPPLDICRAIWKSDIAFDQLIHEGTWVHISFDPRLRRQLLTAHFDQGHVTYSVGIA